MSATTLTTPTTNGPEARTPLISVTQVSVDGADVEVQMRPKKSGAKLQVKEDINANTPKRSSIANR